jgi:hypothetical protein
MFMVNNFFFNHWSIDSFSLSFGVYINVDLRNGLNTSIPTHMSNSYNSHEITTNLNAQKWMKVITNKYFELTPMLKDLLLCTNAFPL